MESGIEAPAVFLTSPKHLTTTLCPTKLIEKLQAIGLDDYLVQWITDFLTNCMQYVVVNSVSSKPLSVISDVPRRSVLGPFLFLDGITELPLSPESKLVMYADDILLY